MIELVFGGAASGKSEFAEREALQCREPFFYLATMRHGSSSGEQRIAKHVARRDGGPFITLEKPVGAGELAEKVKKGTVLLECLTNLAANELFDNEEVFDREHEDRVYHMICSDLDRLASAADSLIVVSGDVFRDGVRYGKESEAYLRLLARLNSYMSDKADIVYEMVFACPRRLK